MNNIWGILGGGFGLYGYLPALYSSSKSIYVHKKYRNFINRREELCNFSNKLIYVETNEEILNSSKCLVICTPPKAQQFYIFNSIPNNSYKYLIIEKPIGINPNIAKLVLEKSGELAESFRVGYTFTDLEWLKDEFISKIKKNGRYRLRWEFMAYHFQNSVQTWKDDEMDGGGVIRFYGIQLIALLESIGTVSVKTSKIKIDNQKRSYEWEASFCINSNVIIYINLCSKSKNNFFEIEDLEEEKKILSLKDPFEKEIQIGGQDMRINPLKKIISNLNKNNKIYYKKYKNINNIWFEIERLNG